MRQSVSFRIAGFFCCLVLSAMLLTSTLAVAQERGSIGLELLDGQLGVEIGRLRKGGPGETAGLRTKDRISSVNGHHVATVADVATVLKGTEVGEEIYFVVSAVGKYYDIRLVADKSPSQFELVWIPRKNLASLYEKKPPPAANADECPARKVAVRGGYQTIEEPCSADIPLLGVSLRNHSAKVPGQQGMASALQIVSVRKNGPVDAAGLREGDLITGCHQSPTYRIPHIFRCLKNAKTGQVRTLYVYRLNTPSTEKIKVTLGEGKVAICNIESISSRDLLYGPCQHLLKQDSWPYLRVIDGKPPYSEHDHFATQRAIVQHYVTMFFQQCEADLPANAASYRHTKDEYVGTVDYIWKPDVHIFRTVTDYYLKLHPELYDQYSEVAEGVYGRYFQTWRKYNSSENPNDDLHTYVKLVSIRAEEVGHDMGVLFRVDGCRGEYLTRMRKGLASLK